MGFQEVENDQAYLKAGLLGLQGSGKTLTAALLAIGLHNKLKSMGIPGGNGTVWMIDTEVGSSWLRKRFDESGVKLLVNKTRSFKALCEGVDAVAEKNGILIIDSITHFWQELCAAYAEKHKRRSLTFGDWGTIKGIWKMFTDAYVNSPAHIIMCGRQGYEYDFFEDDAGKKQLEKTAVKMKGEGETGYEPSLLVVMERHQQIGQNGSIERVWRTAYILKDRADIIDGKSFEDPTFESFAPHIDALNLGGAHVGFDTKDTSTELIKNDSTFKYLAQQREIVLEEIEGIIKKKHPSQSAADKDAKMAIIEKVFHTRSWKKVESMTLEMLREGYEQICKIYGETPLSAPSIAEMQESEAPATDSAAIPF
jgi:hypothetical protein